MDVLMGLDPFHFASGFSIFFHFTVEVSSCSMENCSYNVLQVRQLTNNIDFILDTVRLSTEVEVQGEKIRKRNDWMNWVLPPTVGLEGTADRSSMNVPNLSEVLLSRSAYRNQSQLYKWPSIKNGIILSKTFDTDSALGQI
ncbi:unnamed protein product [Musa textilis]